MSNTEVTADNLTDEQIRKFRDDHPDMAVLCNGALAKPREATRGAREEWRQRIAAAINVRAKAVR